MDDYITPYEAAAILRCSPSYIYNLIKSKDFPAIRLSRKKILISKPDLIRWLGTKTKETQNSTFSNNTANIQQFQSFNKMFENLNQRSENKCQIIQK